MATTKQPTNELDVQYSSVQAIAEVILARLEPSMQDLGSYEFEDIVEDVRNAYAGIIWRIYLQGLDDGDRLVIDPLLQRKRLPVEGDSVVLDGIMVVDVPRDAGIYQVIPYDANNNIAGEPMTKTSVAQAYAPKSRFFPGYRYYRIGDTMYFPDGLPPCAVGVEVIFLGLLDEDSDLQRIPRDYADMVRDKVWSALFPSKQVQADITNNKNPNQ
jgi:hypothetical protein